MIRVKRTTRQDHGHSSASIRQFEPPAKRKSFALSSQEAGGVFGHSLAAEEPDFGRHRDLQKRRDRGMEFGGIALDSDQNERAHDLSQTAPHEAAEPLGKNSRPVHLGRLPKVRSQARTQPMHGLRLSLRSCWTQPERVPTVPSPAYVSPERGPYRIVAVASRRSPWKLRGIQSFQCLSSERQKV